MNLVRSRRVLACIGLLFVLGTVVTSASGQTSTIVRKDLIWSKAENEVASPQFSSDGKLIVFVSRVHWPDGHEAEGLPETFFKKLEERQHKDPRFADPIVRLIDLKGHVLCEARYGYNPSLSPDNKTIAFARQKNPITGLRMLADTLAGNDIEVVDCEKKTARIVAKPEAGYFDDPVFLPDGKSIAYTENEAVNGAYGGPVGLERVYLTGGGKQILLPKRDQAGFSNLLLDFVKADNALLVLLAKPLPSSGDMYMARHYNLSLVSAFPTREEILPLGHSDLFDVSVAVRPVSDGRVLIFSQYWKLLSLKAKTWLPEPGPRNTIRRSSYSPDLKYYLVALPGDDPNRFALYRTRDGRRIFVSPAFGEVYDIAWSPDSKRFAVVAVPRGATGSTYREDLIVYSVP